MDLFKFQTIGETIVPGMKIAIPDLVIFNPGKFEGVPITPNGAHNRLLDGFRAIGETIAPGMEVDMPD